MTEIQKATEIQKKYLSILNTMEKYSNFGATDSEGFHALDRVSRAVLDTKPFPLTGENPFQLYSSVPGWTTANADLVSAARGYWVEGVRAALGLEKE